MIPAKYYHDVFMILTTIITIVVVQKYKTYSNKRVFRRSSSQWLPAFIVMLFCSLFIGLRPQSGVFVDMMNTVIYYKFLYQERFWFDWNTVNIIYDNLLKYFASYGISVQLFFLLIAFIYFGLTYAACHKLFPKDTLLAYVTWLAAFSTFSYGTNGIKAGSAAAVFLLGIAYRKKWWACILLLIASYGMHHSMTVPITAFLLCSIYKNSNVYMVLWVVCFILSVFHVTFFQEWFGTITDDSGAAYLDVNNLISLKAGMFRPDFALYSAVPIVVGWYLIRKKKIPISNGYRFILNLYILTNSIWLLCMYANFTNRIAYLSWLMYPFVLIYPFLKEYINKNQYKTCVYVVYGHLLFTLFMSYIFYPLR